MKSILIPFVFIVILVFSCKPKKSTQDKISISGITYRDIVGFPGSQDMDDWTYDSTWPDFISSTFNFSDTLNYSTDTDTSTITIFGYPNPAGIAMNLSCNSSNSTIIKYIIVDEFVTLYASGTIKLSSGMNTIQLDLSNSIYPANKYYRIYYSFLDKSKNSYYKGHGDIKKN
jgi:hypothetical protein